MEHYEIELIVDFAKTNGMEPSLVNEMKLEKFLENIDKIPLEKLEEFIK